MRIEPSNPCRKHSPASIWLISMNSSGLCACSIEPGLQTTTGTSRRCLNNPPSVPNETLAVPVSGAAWFFRKRRAGQVLLNYPAWNPMAPLGGYKRSGNGREYGVFGLEEYLETKAIVGFG